jgi:hypothetical protein
MEDTLYWKAQLVAMIKQRRVGRFGLKKIFQEWDTNGDGVISRKELRSALQKMSIVVTDHMFAKLFRSIDPDSSGTIDYVEFVKVIYPDGKEAPADYDDAAAESRSEGSRGGVEIEEFCLPPSLGQSANGCKFKSPGVVSPPTASPPLMMANVISVEEAPSSIKFTGGFECIV